MVVTGRSLAIPAVGIATTRPSAPGRTESKRIGQQSAMSSHQLPLKFDDVNVSYSSRSAPTGTNRYVSTHRSKPPVAKWRSYRCLLPYLWFCTGTGGSSAISAMVTVQPFRYLTSCDLGSELINL